MTQVIRFMNAGLGRGTRVALGVALIAVGLTLVGGTGGLILAVVGLLPIAMGFSGRCLLEALPS